MVMTNTPHESGVIPISTLTRIYDKEVGQKSSPTLPIVSLPKEESPIRKKPFCPLS